MRPDVTSPDYIAGLTEGYKRAIRDFQRHANALKPPVFRTDLGYLTDRAAELVDQPIDGLELPTSTRKKLIVAGCKTVGQLCQLHNSTLSKMGLGQKSADDIDDRLSALGLIRGPFTEVATLELEGLEEQVRSETKYTLYVVDWAYWPLVPKYADNDRNRAVQNIRTKARQMLDDELKQTRDKQ